MWKEQRLYLCLDLSNEPPETEVNFDDSLSYESESHIHVASTRNLQTLVNPKINKNQKQKQTTNIAKTMDNKSHVKLSQVP